MTATKHHLVAPSIGTRSESRDGASPLTIRLLAEGDADTRDSWSGSTNSLLQALRSLGHNVTASNVAPSSWQDVASKLATVVPSRAHWAARHHYGPIGFAVRSRRAHRALSSHEVGQPAIQIGATFDGTRWQRGPVYCYCDANALFAARGGAFGPVRTLSPRELSAMVAREREVYSRMTGIFAMSECLRRSFIEDFGVAADRVVTVPAGPNMRMFPDEGETESRRPSVPTVLFVGRQFERKGGPTLVAAFRHVREAIPNARLVIAGCAPQLGDVAGVSVVGPLTTSGTGRGSLTSAYREAHLFCMPSRYEPFGVVFVEAMMHNLPCVGADAWAMPELIEHGRSGWLARPNDVRDLARILIDALGNADRLREMGAHARRRAGDVFTWNRAATIMTRVLNQGEQL